MAHKKEAPPSPAPSGKHTMRAGSERPGEELPLDEVIAYFEEKRRLADDRFITPLQGFLRDAFATHPLLSIFVAVFVALSFIPVVSFLGFAVFTGSLLVGGAIVFVLFWGAVILSIAAGVLLFTLSITFFCSLLLCGLLATVFLFLRLFTHVTTNEQGVVEGVKSFGTEVRERAVGPRKRVHSPKPAPKHSASKPTKAEEAGLSPESSSSDSWKVEDS